MKKLGWAIALLAAAGPAPAIAGTISYSFDQLGRLTQAAYPGGAVIRYSYDPNGNRTSYVVTGSANPPPTGTTPIGQAQVIQTSAATVEPATSQSAPK